MNYFDLLKAKHGLPVSDAYTALLGKKLQGGGYPVTEIFGQLPFSFLSRGASISEWALYGKFVQNGTPSVQAKTLELGTLVQDSYVSSTDGVITPYSSWDRTDYIAIPVDMKHITVEVDSTYNNKYNCWYDEDKQFISSFTIWNASSGTKILTADVPANAKYVIFSGPRNWMESASVEYQIIQPIPVQGVGERTVNLYDINAKDTNNGYVNNAQLGQDGTATVWGSAEISEYIPINGDTAYTFNGIGSYNSSCYALYDENKLLIGAYRYNGASIIHFTSPDNARYFRFTHIKATTSAMLVKGSYTQQTMPTFEPYGYKIMISSAGQIVPVYLGQTQTVRKVKKLVLDGVNDGEWKKSSTRTGSFYLNIGSNARVSLGLCDRAVNVGAIDLYNSVGKMFVEPVSSAKIINLWLFDTDMSVADFQTWLAAQYAAGTPVTVWYVLAEPTTGIVNEPLMKIGDYADELRSTDAGVTIPTVKGANTLTTDTTVHGNARIKGRIEEV